MKAEHYYMLIALKGARRILDEVIESTSNGSLTEEELEFQLYEAIYQTSFAWYCRDADVETFESIEGPEIEAMRRTVPNLHPTYGPMEFVNRDTTLKDFKDGAPPSQ